MIGGKKSLRVTNGVELKITVSSVNRPNEFSQLYENISLKHRCEKLTAIQLDGFLFKK